MSYQTGIASDRIDLSDKIVTFASANGWTVLKNDVYSAPDKEVFLRSPSINGKDIVIGWQTKIVSGVNYVLQLTACPLYQGNSFGLNQYELAPGTNAYIKSSNIAHTYHFFINDKRLVVATFDFPVYLGYLRAFANKTDWEKPIIVGYNMIPFRTNHFIVNAFGGENTSFKLLLNDNTWESGESQPIIDKTGKGFFPSFTSVFNNMPDGTAMCSPLNIYDTSQDGYSGELYNFFWVNSATPVTSDEININGDLYYVFQQNTVSLCVGK